MPQYHRTFPRTGALAPVFKSQIVAVCCSVLRLSVLRLKFPRASTLVNIVKGQLHVQGVVVCCS